MLHPRLNQSTTKYWGHQPLPGDVGIEIELEGDNLPRNVPGWSAKRDGSLRGANSRQVSDTEPEDTVDMPREYVTQGPVLMANLPTTLASLSSRLQDGPTIRTSTRTSTHIHVNMLGCSVREFLGYIICHAIIEPVLLRAAGPERNGNLFCLPLSETADLHTVYIPQWIQAMVSYPNGAAGKYWNKRGKYACLNTDPIHELGSVEVRCFPASIDTGQIHKWAKWVTNVRTLAQEWPDETYGTLLEKAYTDPLSIAHQVFTGQPNLMELTYPNNTVDLIRSGVEVSYEIWRALQPVFDFKKEEKKKSVKKATWDYSYEDDEPIGFAEVTTPFLAAHYVDDGETP